MPLHILPLPALGIQGVSVTNPLRRACARVCRAWKFDFVIMTTVLANIIVLCLYRPNDPPAGRRAMTLGYFNLFFTCAFSLEMLIKLVALGPWRYVRNYWHWLDVAVIAAGFLDFVYLGEGNRDNGSIAALRAARALRPLRTVQFFPGLKMLVTTIVNSLPMVSSVVLLCVYLLILFGILGVDMFGARGEESVQLRRLALGLERRSTASTCLLISSWWGVPSASLEPAHNALTTHTRTRTHPPTTRTTQATPSHRTASPWARTAPSSTNRSCPPPRAGRRRRRRRSRRGGAEACRTKT